MTPMNAAVQLQVRQARRTLGSVECRLVTCLIQAMTTAGIAADPVDVINVYVALKSKPLVLLAGPGQSGKVALVQCLARLLTQADPLRCQFLPGHAWWAAESGDVGLFTEAQTRWNASKILALIEEAWQPASTERIHLACLTRISPAEVHEFFTAVAFQLRHGSLMRLPTAHFVEPVPYPPNLFVVGTLDAMPEGCQDEDLLAQTAVIEWPGVQVSPAAPMVSADPPPDADRAFLRAIVRQSAAVDRKLARIPGWQGIEAGILNPLLALLTEQAVDRRQALRQELRVYLANAWSSDGRGLFDPEPVRNASIAFDQALAQLMRTRFKSLIHRSPALRAGLGRHVAGQLPRTHAWLKSLG
jgi:hypothetical protein